MKNYELMAFLASKPADAEIEIWGPFFKQAATFNPMNDEDDPVLAYSVSANTIMITFADCESEEVTQ